jgi:hypothetical protein
MNMVSCRSKLISVLLFSWWNERESFTRGCFKGFFWQADYWRFDLTRRQKESEEIW